MPDEEGIGDALGRFRAGNWATIQSSWQLSAQRQIEASILHLYSREYECAVTLALAAEDQIPEPDGIYLFKAIKGLVSDKRHFDLINDLRNWLKHYKPPAEREISEFEAAVAAVRAVSKFFAAYGIETPIMERFVLWCVEKKLITQQVAPDDL